MKLKHRTEEPKKSKPSRIEPMAEGITKAPKPRGFYARMSDDEMIAFTKRFIADRGIKGRSELQKADTGMYKALMKKRLLDYVGLQKKHMEWAGMEKHELVSYAISFVAENSITGRTELTNSNPGLYGALMRRKLLGRIGLESTHETNRDWDSMSREELIAFAEGVIAEESIERKVELRNADLGLYKALLKRKLISELRLEIKKRDWFAISDEQLVAIAVRFIIEKKISVKSKLKEADGGLHITLDKRRLLDTVFSEVESSKNKEAVEGVIEALGSFGDEK